MDWLYFKTATEANLFIGVGARQGKWNGVSIYDGYGPLKVQPRLFNECITQTLKGSDCIAVAGGYKHLSIARSNDAAMVASRMARTSNSELIPEWRRLSLLGISGTK